MKFLTFCFCLISFTFTNAQFAKYVNPFIGTGGTGHTFPGATTPFAMVQLSPDTRIDGSWEGCSGYHYSDSIIHGFSHTHLSGTGCSDYGDIAFMPWFSKTDEFEKLKTWDVHSTFSHKDEKASAGFYSVVLNDIPVKVELTATTRTGFQRYTFKEDGFGYVVLNLKHRDELIEGKIEKSKPKTYKGIRVSKAWAKQQELYYGFEVNTEATNEFIVKDNGNDTKLILKFKVAKGQQILIKTGISTVDANAALNNLRVENPSWNFDQVKQQAFNSWEKELSKIEVADAFSSPLKGKVRERLFTFYTALYHCMIHPSIMNDVDGRYKGRDGKIHKAEGFNYYTVFSLWDTHRALHPLLNIIDKKRSHDFIITFLKQFEQSGRLPMWELWNNETDCMIGFHSVSVILDAYRKQVISKEELQQLWPAVKAEAMSNRFGLDKFREKGYLSVEDESESVSKTLEYSYDMWCVSEIAYELDLRLEGKYFMRLEQGGNDLLNPKTGFVEPRKNGNWLSNFNPYEVNNNYTEANAWQYSFYAPHGYLTYHYKLKELFKAKNQTEGRIQADITGLIGQYAHGNEPSHNYIYLLNDSSRFKYLQYVYDNFYNNKPDGLIGNEDCGQMSAWYVMSALGFYQTCPGLPSLKIGSPIFSSAKLFIDNQKSNDISQKIISLIETNKKKKKADIIRIREIDFELEHSVKIDSLFENINFKSDINGKKGWDFFVEKPMGPFKKSPIIKSDQSIFYDTLNIRIENSSRDIFGNENGVVHYSINGNKPIVYVSPFKIYSSSFVKAFTVYTYESFKKDTSNLSIAHFYKRPHNYAIQLNCKYNKQYTADGDDGVIDSQLGDIDWRKGGWQGYQSQDFEAVIDLKEAKTINEISANFLQDTRSWILMPTKVEFYTSTDNIDFKLAGVINNTVAAEDYAIQTQKLKLKTQHVMARFIKIKAYNYGKLPAWHAGKGDDAFIFIDEIEIK